MLSDVGKSKCWHYAEEDKEHIETISKLPIRFTEKDFIVNEAKLPIDVKYIQESGNFNKHTNQHYGQRKLFLGELLFLCKIFDKYKLNLTNSPKVKVLYIGSADGTHIEYLHRLFNNRLELTLYDNADFSRLLYNRDGSTISGITIHQKLFDDVELAKYNTDNCDVFISDIRSSDVGKWVREQGIYRDMALQNKWVLAIKPKLGAMLKFKLPEPKSSQYMFLNEQELKEFRQKIGKDPYASEDTQKRGMEFNVAVNTAPNTVGYLTKTHYTSIKGTIVRQCYPPKHSHETRLIIFNEDLDKTMNLDLEQYDKLGIYHNNFKRPWITYHLNLLGLDTKKLLAIGYDKCFDCTYEIYIWNLFKQLYDKSVSGGNFDIIRSIVDLEKVLGQRLRSDIHGFIKGEESVYQKTIRNTLSHEVKDNWRRSGGSYSVCHINLIILIIILIILLLLFTKNIISINNYSNRFQKPTAVF